MRLADIRKSFLDFFEGKGHARLPSSPLLPKDDPTLLFTNSGMVQFKNYFTGTETSPFKTATTAQKCIRAGGKHNDLENVGYTGRHHTFFEMLGNFSFGDYFKEEAISYAWEYIYKHLQLDTSRLYFTVYHDDNEAYSLWKKIAGVSDNRIIRIATNDNFWSMGDTGPCGPCTEIFYDYGDSVPGGLPGSADEDGDRFVEIWNLVFMHYESLPDGSRIKLPKPSVDTGMGLERISSVMAGKTDNYDTDLFQALINASKVVTHNFTDMKSHRVIADHIRSISFLIADGVLPSNEGRGYVLRRVIRRATRHAHNLGAKDLSLYKMVPTLTEQMGEQYPELKDAKELIEKTLYMEEDKFRTTLDTGMKHLEEGLQNVGKNGIFPGAVAFKLYDTYGFPLDLTRDVLKEKDIGLDEAGFERNMEEQRTRAQAAWKNSLGDFHDQTFWYKLEEELGKTHFIGYRALESDAAKVVALVQNGEKIQTVEEGEAFVILHETPFYAEAGGQVGDIGLIGGNEVLDTQKKAHGLYVHKVKLKHRLAVAELATATVDAANRACVMANHTATHLLHYVLRKHLGKHVVQKGSLVDAERLRFDFSHDAPIDKQKLIEIETEVNAMIMQNIGSDTQMTSQESAKAMGAMALFGEKYPPEVRVVKFADSIELCGGTHVNSTGAIGLFKIIQEEAIASGVRRIVAITGKKANEYCAMRLQILEDLAKKLKTNVEGLDATLTNLLNKSDGLNKQVAQLSIANLISTHGAAADKFGPGHKVYIVANFDTTVIKQFVEEAAVKHPGRHIICIVNNAEKLSVVARQADGVAGFDAGDFIKKLCAALDGKGGGNAKFAQGGGAAVAEAMLEEVLTKLLRGTK